MSRLDLFFHFSIASFFCGIKYSCLLSCDLLRYSTTYVTDHFIICRYKEAMSTRVLNRLIEMKNCDSNKIKFHKILTKIFVYCLKMNTSKCKNQ